MRMLLGMPFEPVQVRYKSHHVDAAKCSGPVRAPGASRAGAHALVEA